MPQISVIVPVYKVEPYLHRCVDSILGQTFTDFELILVDDGSPDSCPAICNEYARKDSRVHVIHQQNGGLSAARNAGIDWAFANSDSQWISFVDSDDWVCEDFLQYLLMAVQQYSVSVACCGIHQIRSENASMNTGGYRTSLQKTEDIYCAPNGTGIEAYACKFLYQKTLFNDTRFPIGRIFEDVFTTYKVIFQSQYVAKVEQDLYYYFYHENSISHSAWTPRKMDIVDAYEENLNYFKAPFSNQLMRCLARGYLIALHTQYVKMQKSSLPRVQMEQYRMLMQKRMRRALFRYSGVADIHLKTDGYLYAVAYPRLTELYWRFSGWIASRKKKDAS